MNPARYEMNSSPFHEAFIVNLFIAGFQIQCAIHVSKNFPSTVLKRIKHRNIPLPPFSFPITSLHMHSAPRRLFKEVHKATSCTCIPIHVLNADTMHIYIYTMFIILLNIRSQLLMFTFCRQPSSVPHGLWDSVLRITFFNWLIEMGHQVYTMPIQNAFLAFTTFVFLLILPVILVSKLPLPHRLDGRGPEPFPRPEESSDCRRGLGGLLGASIGSGDSITRNISERGFWHHANWYEVRGRNHYPMWQHYFIGVDLYTL